MARKRKATNALNPRSARAMLRALKEFSGDFQSIALTEGRLTISVTFNGHPAPRPMDKRKKPGADERRPTAIDSLSMTAPSFKFEMPEN